MNRFRLELDRSLYAPSYAALIGAFLARATALTFVTNPIVEADPAPPGVDAAR